MALADNGYVDPHPSEQYQLIETLPILAALASRGYEIRPRIEAEAAAGPRDEGLRATFHSHRDGCNGRPHRRWYRGENKCDTLARLAIEAEAAAGPRDEGLLEAAMRRAVHTDDLFALVNGGAWWSLRDTRVVARRILRECAALQAATPPEDEG
jgi:hypothetical protein